MRHFNTKIFINIECHVSAVFFTYSSNITSHRPFGVFPVCNWHISTDKSDSYLRVLRVPWVIQSLEESMEFKESPCVLGMCGEAQHSHSRIQGFTVYRKRSLKEIKENTYIQNTILTLSTCSLFLHFPFYSKPENMNKCFLQNCCSTN